MALPLIIPAILESTTDALIEQIMRVDRELPDVRHVHIDIMDGSFVPHKNEIDVEELEMVSTRLKYEIHFMTHQPEQKVWEWAEIANVFRVIRHMEAMGDVGAFLGEAAQSKLECGVAFNPLTDYYDTDYKTFDFVEQGGPELVQFMTVHPGAQGGELVPSVIEKIKQYQEMNVVYKDAAKPPLCSVDGNINPDTIGLFKNVNIDIFNVGSYLMHAQDMAKSYGILKALLK